MILKNSKFNIILFLFYIVITTILMLCHELWRDEAQAWCIVRACNFFQMFQAVRLEGHPLLWYLLLVPFAKAGCSVLTMQLLSFIFVSVAAGYFIFRAPFNNFIKTIFVLSSGMLYYLPVVARNYSLIPLFLFMLADLYERRKEHPYIYTILLILLSDTHILMLGFCVLLAVFFMYEQLEEKKWLPNILLSLNFLYLFLSFYNMQNVNHATAFYAANTEPFIKTVIHFAELYGISPEFTIVFYILICFIAFSFCKFDRKLFFIFTGSLIYQFFVFYKIWYQGLVYQKAFLFFLIAFFCLWQLVPKNQTKTLLIGKMSIIILLFFSSLYYSYIPIGDIKYPFSGGKEIAKFIKNNLNDEQTFNVVGYPFVFSVISAYLPDKKLYSPTLGRYISYYDFNFNNKKEVMCESSAEYFIIQDDFIPNSEYEEIYASNKEIVNFGEYNEIFKIYKKRKKL